MKGGAIDVMCKFLKAMWWVAVLDLVLGLVLTIGVVAGVASPTTLRGAFVLLVVGALGVFWFRSALRRLDRQAV